MEPLFARISRYVAIGAVLVMAALLIAILGAANAAAAAANRQLQEQIEGRERAENALRQSQKMEALGQLTGGVAHDFNNLLMAASAGLELMQRAKTDEKKAQLEAGIRDALDRGGRLTQQLLDFSRRTPAQTETIDVARRLGALSDLLNRSLGETVEVRFAIAPDLWPIEADAAQFDVAILNPPVLDDLITQRKIVAATRTVLGRSGIGVAIREGAPKPDISTVAAFTRTLLNARTVAYPGEGASGRYFVSVVDRLGLTEKMQSKMRPMPGEYNVEVVARGEVEMVVVVASRISGVPGVQLVGRIPQELQTWIGFTGGLGAAAREPEAALALLRFMSAPAAAAVLQKTGIEPFVE